MINLCNIGANRKLSLRMKSSPVERPCRLGFTIWVALWMTSRVERKQRYCNWGYNLVIQIESDFIFDQSNAKKLFKKALYG